MSLDEKILAYLDGASTPAEVAELEGILASDPAARERFARLCEQDAAVRQILSCGPAGAAGRRPRPRRGAWRRVGGPPGAPWVPIVVAAGGLFALILFAAALSSGPTRPPRDLQAVRPRQAPLETRAPEPRVEAPRPLPPPVPAPEPLPPKPEPPRPEPSKPEPQKPEPQPEPPRPEPIRPEPPAPKPDPKPAPPPAPAPKPSEVEAVVARAERVRGQVQIGPGPAKDGQAILPGQALQTAGAESGVLVRFLDQSQVELGGDTRLAQITHGAGKRIELSLGTVTAQVTRQPAGQAMTLLTPHAEARVLGTKLTLTVSASETRLEVREGRVRLTRLSDGASTDVGAGQFALASEAVRPSARRIPPPGPKLLFGDDFEDAGVEARWQRLENGLPTTFKGAVEIDVSPRPGAPYAGGGWHPPGGLRTKQYFPVPFRLSADVEITHRNDFINVLLVLIPRSGAAGAPRNEFNAVKNEVAVRLRGGEYSIMVEGDHQKQADRTWTPPLKERWTVEFDLKEIRLLANGKELLRHAHGLKIADDYRVELQATAKVESPAGSRVRFDGVRIEP